MSEGEELTLTIHSPICGDGLIVGPEKCDDKNQNSKDGCAKDCLSIDPGWECFQSVCSPICGNGKHNDGEECDDNNNTDFDGCSQTCKVEPGYKCKDGVCAIPNDVVKPEMKMKEIDFAKKQVQFDFNVDMKTDIQLTPDDMEFYPKGPQEPYTLTFTGNFKDPKQFIIEYDIDPPFTGGAGESLSIAVVNEHKFQSLSGLSPFVPEPVAQEVVKVTEEGGGEEVSAGFFQ